MPRPVRSKVRFSRSIPHTVYNDKDLLRTEFIAKYEEIFDQTTRLCFSGKKTAPIADNDFYYGYSVFCGSSIYSFEKFEGEYKFSNKYPDD